MISLADDLKSAATDSLKKAATLLGVGLHLYGPEEAPSAPPTKPKLVPKEPAEEEPAEEEPDVPATNRLTRKQSEFISKLGRSQGLAKGELEDMARERYGRQCAYLTVQQASDFIKALSDAA